LTSTNLQTDIPDSRDENLVMLARGGNTVAFGQLIDRYRGFVARIVARFLMREEECHDVIQDTFIRVWKHLGDFDGRCLFTTWIYTIAFNLCLDRVKIIRRRREIRFPADFEPGYCNPGEFTDPASHADHAVLAQAVQTYSAGLSEVQRLVFILRDLQDLPVAEVCRVTGFTTDKVKSNLYYARKFMREKLEKGGYL
jgi:RNA polymerase sigma-70 factor, ECF subfamily